MSPDQGGGTPAGARRRQRGARAPTPARPRPLRAADAARLPPAPTPAPGGGGGGTRYAWTASGRRPLAAATRAHARRRPRRVLTRRGRCEPASQKRQGRSAAFVIPIRTPVTIVRPIERGTRLDRIGPVRPSATCRSARARCRAPGSACPARCRGAPRACRGRAALAHQVDALGRLERADQDRGADARVLDDRVQQRVDAVGAVDVGDARRARTAGGCARSGRRGRGRRAPPRGSSRSRRSGRPSSPWRTTQPSRSRATVVDVPVVEVAARAGQRTGERYRGAPATAARAPGRAARGRARATCRPRRPSCRASRRRAAAPRPSSPSCGATSATSAGSSSDELPALLDRPAHEAGDDAVRLAERHAAAHQLVGDVGRGGELVGGRGGHALAAEGDRPEHRRAPPGATARPCRPRRTGAPCPPGGPCCRSAAARA